VVVAVVVVVAATTPSRSPATHVPSTAVGTSRPARVASRARTHSSMTAGGRCEADPVGVLVTMFLPRAALGAAARRGPLGRCARGSPRVGPPRGRPPAIPSVAPATPMTRLRLRRIGPKLPQRLGLAAGHVAMSRRRKARRAAMTNTTLEASRTAVQRTGSPVRNGSSPM